MSFALPFNNMTAYNSTIVKKNVFIVCGKQPQSLCLYVVVRFGLKNISIAPIVIEYNNGDTCLYSHKYFHLNKVCLAPSHVCKCLFAIQYRMRVV